MIGGFIGTMRAQQVAQKYALAKTILLMTDAVGFECGMVEDLVKGARRPFQEVDWPFLVLDR